MLAHHLSLPKTSAELSAIEKFLQLQDSVPCKIRAKRGCATHPRSIAERVKTKDSWPLESNDNFFEIYYSCFNVISMRIMHR